MTIRELVTFLINKYDLEDSVRYDPENSIDNIRDTDSEKADVFFVDEIEKRDGYVWLYEEAGRRRK